MFSKVKSVRFFMSDCHLGEGVDSPNEDFKYHPLGVPMNNTQHDHVLDVYFYDFINWILQNTNHCSEVKLILNGDMFDFSAVSLPDEDISLPYEEDAVAKFQIIMRAHPVFFMALAKFCTADNTAVELVIGNHDFPLNWPAIQEMLVQKISPDNPAKVHFLAEQTVNATYNRHGESEPHTKTNHKKPIITAVEISKLPIALKYGNLDLARRDVLDVSISHYLSSDLMYHLKKCNYLIARMHIHKFVWKNGVKYIGIKSWYRSRWFFFYGVYYLARTMFKYVFRAKFWHIKKEFALTKLLKVLHWSFTGVFSGHTPRDSAIKILHTKEEVDCVVYSHEHECTFEVMEIGGKIKTYINTGTWTPQFREKSKKQATPWKKFQWLQKFIEFFAGLFTPGELESVWRCPVAVETIDDSGVIRRQLDEWDREEKTLKQLS